MRRDRGVAHHHTAHPAQTHVLERAGDARGPARSSDINININTHLAILTRLHPLRGETRQCHNGCRTVLTLPRDEETCAPRHTHLRTRLIIRKVWNVGFLLFAFVSDGDDYSSRTARDIRLAHPMPLQRLYSPDHGCAGAPHRRHGSTTRRCCPWPRAQSLSRFPFTRVSRRSSLTTRPTPGILHAWGQWGLSPLISERVTSDAGKDSP